MLLAGFGQTTNADYLGFPWDWTQDEPHLESSSISMDLELAAAPWHTRGDWGETLLSSPEVSLPPVPPVRGSVGVGGLPVPVTLG